MPKRGPVFLKRRSYRRRRLRDLARMLPVAGLFLFLLPILWAPSRSTPAAFTAPADTAPDGLFLFGVWLMLILVAAALAPSLSADAGEDGSEEER
jgi:hypothetical protein